MLVSDGLIPYMCPVTLHSPISTWDRPAFTWGLSHLSVS